ncbi:unnamed protein product [Coffea canephora]|uniref:Dirigent protein n=1 Tax=Coffea canephora TaxID=49390 RepID=A0A068UKZ5_COFCA|nr:unnamed protein product [Coffea canephora]
MSVFVSSMQNLRSSKSIHLALSKFKLHYHFQTRSFRTHHHRFSNSNSRIRKPIPYLDEIKRCGDTEEALSIFYQYKEKGFKHDYPSYSALMYKLAKARNFEAVETLLDSLKNYNIRCKETLFIALFQVYCKAKLSCKAIELFRNMTSFNCVRTLQSFNAILNALVDDDCLSDANEIFGESANMGLRLNSVSFNIMMKMWLQKGEWDRAREVFDEMLEREVKPSVVTYNSLIGFLCKRGELDKAKDLVKDMMKKGKRPNAVTYALLMEGLCFVGKFKEAKKLMFDMEYQGCKPRSMNYGVLMTDLGKRGEFDKAKGLLIEMKKRKMRPDVVMFNILINCLCKVGRAAEAYKLLVEMQVGGCEPNAASYRMMVDGFCRAGEFESGVKVLNAMLRSRHFPRPETVVCLFMGLIKSGNLDNACFILEEMLKRKIMIDLKSWEALVVESCGEEMDVNRIMTKILEVVAPTLPPEGTDPVDPPVPNVTPGGTAAPAAVASSGVGAESPDHMLTFFMHDILGGSTPSAIAVTGVVTNPAVGGQVPFAKPNGAVLPVNNGIPVNNANSGIINNNNIPFLTGLSGTAPNLVQQNGNSIIGGGFGFPALNPAQFPTGTTFQSLMFGTMTVFDDELTEGHELGSGLVGKAQGFYIASSEDGTSQTMAFTGLATVKTFPANLNQHSTDGVETVLEITVYLAY